MTEGYFEMGVVACTCKPETLETKHGKGASSTPVGGNSPPICGSIV